MPGAGLEPACWRLVSTSHSGQGPLEVALTDDLPLFVSARESEAAKEAALVAHATRERAPLERLRLALRALYQWRRRTDDTAYVTADDAVVVMQDWPVEERPHSLSCLGALFRAPGWRWVGFTRSARVSNQAADLRKWVWERQLPLDAPREPGIVRPSTDPS